MQGDFLIFLTFSKDFFLNVWFLRQSKDWYLHESDHSWELAGEQLLAKKPERLWVSCFKIEDKEVKWLEDRELFRRPVHWKLRPEEGWKFIMMEFPGKNPESWAGSDVFDRFGFNKKYRTTNERQNSNYKTIRGKVHLQGNMYL